MRQLVPNWTNTENGEKMFIPKEGDWTEVNP